MPTPRSPAAPPLSRIPCTRAQEEESELQQVEQELASSDMSKRPSEKSLGAPGSQRPQRGRAAQKLLGMMFSPVLLKAFTLTFLAEWGDRSQIATIT